MGYPNHGDLMSARIVFFIFAGREVNMRIQMPYLERLLAKYPEAVLDLWDLTRNAADQEYLRGLAGSHEGRVRVLGHLHPGHPIPCRYPGQTKRRRGHAPCKCIVHVPPYEEPYRWYALKPYPDDTVFVKLDDDVLFLETERFDDLIAPLAQHPNRVISANVINNAMCAKHDPAQEAYLGGKFILGDRDNPTYDWAWWALHESGEFAIAAHAWFLNCWHGMSGAIPLGFVHHRDEPTYVRTRPGEAVSINCIAFTYPTMVRLAKAFEHSPHTGTRLGDEGAVDQLLPWICLTFHAAHLTFGPQDAALNPVTLDTTRQYYAALAETYLNR